MYCTDCKRADSQHDIKTGKVVEYGKVICEKFNSGIDLQVMKATQV